MVHRCLKCGVKVRHRIVEREPMAALPNVQGYDMTRCSITCMEPGCLNKIYYENRQATLTYL